MNLGRRGERAISRIVRNPVVRKIDDVILNSSIQENHSKHLKSLRLVEIEARCDYRQVILHGKNPSDLLSLLCDKYGSDKGTVTNTSPAYPWPAHSYADFYSRLYRHCRFNVHKVFECGIGTNNPDLLPPGMDVPRTPGASLRVWRDYFPNAIVVGADIDRDTLFEEERIRTFYIDQTDPKAIAEFWETVALGDFDFIVDDGLHTFEAGRVLFEESISRLAKDGIYVIEDVRPVDLLRYQNYFPEKEYLVDYVNLYRPGTELADNNLVVVRHPQFLGEL